MRKLLSIALVFTTVLWAMGFGAFIPVASATANLEAGDLIKGSHAAVYYYATDGNRYTFPTQSTYMTWYTDFSGVKTITDDELAAIDLAGNIVVRPGTNLVKIQSVPKVFAVEPNGMLTWVETEEVAEALYGENWAQRVIDVPDGFWVNYTDSGEALDGTEFPEGSLIQYEGTSDVYYVSGDGTQRRIANESAFDANGFQWDYILTAPSGLGLTDGPEINGYDEDLYDPSQGGGAGSIPPASVGGALTVSFAGDNPMGMAIPANSTAEFVKYDLMAGSDAVKINAIKISAGGLSTATNIKNVTLYVAGSKVGSSKNINSSKEATFNFSDPIMISAGATKELVVKATVIANGYYALGINEASDITTNASSLNGSFPLMGNSHQAAANSAIGSVEVDGVDTVSNSNVAFGEDDVLVAAFDLTAKEEPVLWESMRMRNGGTNDDELINNCRILVNGDEIATGDYYDRYLEADLNNYRIDKSDKVNVEVYCDMGLGNVGNKVIFYVKDRDDFAFLGEDYGFGVQFVDGSSTAKAWNNSGTGFSNTTNAKNITLTAGSVSMDMDKSATPAKDVKPDTSDVVLATFSIVSNGENATINSIADAGATKKFRLEGSGLQTAEIENVEMRDVATGALYDIAATFTTDHYTLSITDEISLAKGVEKTYEIRADLTDIIDNTNTVKVVLDSGAISIEGDTSSANLQGEITPSNVSSAITTVKDASLILSATSLTSKTVVSSTEDVVVYQATVEAGNADDVKLKSLKLTTDTADARTFDDANISELKLYLDGVLLKTSSNDIVEAADATSSGTITFNSLSTTNDANVIEAGETVNLMVKASFSSSFTLTGDKNWLLKVNASGDLSARSVVGNKVVLPTGSSLTATSRTVTLAETGKLKVDLQTTGTKVDEDSYLLAGSETEADKYLAELVFTTQNEAVKVKTLTLTDSGSATGDDIAKVKLVEGDGTVVAEKVPTSNGSVTFDPFDVVFPADEATSLYLAIEAKGMNVNGDPTSTANYGATMSYKISAVTAEGYSGTALTVGAAGDGSPSFEEYDDTDASKQHIVVGSVLKSLENDMANGTLTGGDGKIVGKYNLVFDNGSNRTSGNSELKAQLNEAVFAVAKSDAVRLATVSMYVEGTTTEVGTTANTCNAAGTSCTLTFASDRLNSLAESGLVDGEVVLVLKGNIVTTTDQYLQTSISDLSSVFNYNGNHGTGSDLTNMLLGKTSESGATLSN